MHWQKAPGLPDLSMDQASTNPINVMHMARPMLRSRAAFVEGLKPFIIAAGSCGPEEGHAEGGPGCLTAAGTQPAQGPDDAMHGAQTLTQAAQGLLKCHAGGGGLDSASGQAS